MLCAPLLKCWLHTRSFKWSTNKIVKQCRCDGCIFSQLGARALRLGDVAGTTDALVLTGCAGGPRGAGGG